jgi:hypothetical protein
MVTNIFETGLSATFRWSIFPVKRIFFWPESEQTIRLNNRQGVLVMFEVTELATENLKTYMEQNKIDSALRVALMSGG